MTRGHIQLEKLRDDQARASDPGEDVWLSASAGTGKTHVLAARVYRLLLSKDVKPESILCLTFTKAGAAEMAERIHRRLADWVRLPTPALRKDLFALGEAHLGDEVVNRARTLFARVLDARGGGLRIQTIHSFCQSLLGAFPAEIGLLPGFRPMEAREESALANQVLADMVVAAQAEGRLGLLDDLRTTVLRLSEDRTRSFLASCARVPDAMANLPDGDALRVTLCRALCDGLGDPEGWLRANCDDDFVGRTTISALLTANRDWRTKAGTPVKDGEKASATIATWLAATPAVRVDLLETLETIWLTGKQEPRAKMPDDPDYPDLLSQFSTWAARLITVKKGAVVATELAAALSVGKEFAGRYAETKRRAGLVDFDDLIRKTVDLLAMPGIGEWIRYKLDQSTDHILVDEAQDTNAPQWAIVEALADEFYVGEGAKGAKRRTIFTVGDYKQAIFGFQGTNPQEFSDARDRFADRANSVGRELLTLSLSESFRSTPPILAAVDAVIDEIGHAGLGLKRPDPKHISARGQYGAVTLWPPVDATIDDAGDDDEEAWITESERALAMQIADAVKGWLDKPLYLTMKKTYAKPEDIMILVRSRRDLARLIVARLQEVNVKVAGLDRLRLNAPLAVRDLLACIRFAVQPGDDLNLAALLVSPIIGWDQDELYRHAFKRDGTLWRAIREGAPAPLSTMLDLADRVTPYRFLETILSGEIDARHKLMVRMGPEVRDPIDELLTAALAFEQNATPSLQAFLDWFDRGDVDVKRDPSAPESAVRVMTVHGAKGLQAPIVILADATRDPDANRATQIDWALDEGLTVPIFTPRKAASVAALDDAMATDKAREREEHWRLLYVAMTRAEERLYIGGALSKRQADKGYLSPDCWHSACERALRTIGATTMSDGTLVYADMPDVLPCVTEPALSDARVETNLPAWVREAAPAEERPPRPLAPSALGSDDVALPPPSHAMRAAAERGRWLHSLFERLPDIAFEDRRAAATRWLTLSAGVDDPDVREPLITDALQIIDHPDFAEIFAPDALAEAPLAGIVNGVVISGTVDRLVISDNVVTVIDFKTGSRIPRAISAAPRSHLRQMSAYAAVLAGIFPTRSIRAGLLYTAGPRLLWLGTDELDAHKPPYVD
ncbi:MAG: double-strand break repair helicase AddA [Sphingomonadaceae bacterium]